MIVWDTSPEPYLAQVFYLSDQMHDYKGFFVLYKALYR